MPNRCIQPQCFPLQPNGHANLAVFSRALFRRSQTGVAKQPFLNLTSHQLSQIGMPNSCNQGQCFPTQLNRHAKLPYSATMCPTQPIRHAKHPYSAALFSNSANRHAKEPYSATLFPNPAKLGKGCVRGVSTKVCGQSPCKGFEWWICQGLSRRVGLEYGGLGFRKLVTKRTIISSGWAW